MPHHKQPILFLDMTICHLNVYLNRCHPEKIKTYILLVLTEAATQGNNESVISAGRWGDPNVHSPDGLTIENEITL